MSVLLNEAQASEYLGNIPIRTLQRWRLEGNYLPFVKIGKAVRYRQKDLDDYVLDNVHSSTSSYPINEQRNSRKEGQSW